MRKRIYRVGIAAIASAVLSIPALAQPASAGTGEAASPTSASPTSASPTSEAGIARIWYEYADYASVLGCNNAGRWLQQQYDIAEWKCVPSSNRLGWWTLLWAPY